MLLNVCETWRRHLPSHLTHWWGSNVPYSTSNACDSREWLSLTCHINLAPLLAYPQSKESCLITCYVFLTARIRRNPAMRTRCP